MLWTLFASAAYCSYLYPHMKYYEVTPEAVGYLTLRLVFFFLAAMVVNRFSQFNRSRNIAPRGTV